MDGLGGNIKKPSTNTIQRRHQYKALAESGESEESGELKDEDDEELPTKSELEWMILKYLQPIHRYPSILRANIWI